MKTGIIVPLISGVLLTGVCAHASEALQKLSFQPVQRENLCPLAEPRSVINFEGSKIRVPASPDEKLMLVEKVDSQDKDEAQKAVMSLALGGSLQTFRDLLKKQDARLLQTYAISYQNQDRSVCIDPEIEKAVIEHFDNPELRMSFLSFFVKNKYRDRALFRELLNLELDLEDMRTFGFVVKALLATNLPGIEEQVLDHAKKYTLNIDLKYWSFLRSVDQLYMEFFLKRKYKPSVQYMKSILDEAHYSTAGDMYSTHVINRHTAIYYRLDRFPSALVGDIFEKQLAKLENVLWDEIFSIELELAGRYAMKHALSYEKRGRIVEHLSKILKREDAFSERIKEENKIDYIDYKVRDQVCELLAQSGTDDAVAALIRELNRLADIQGEKSADALITHILIKLGNLPNTINPDMHEFVKAVRKLKQRTRILIVPRILAKYPHPEGHEYLLSLLDFIVTSGEKYKMLYGNDYKTAWNQMINTLLLFDKAEYLFSTRLKIEELFEKGKLDEDLYVAASKQLKSLIGNESPVFTLLMETREASQSERMTD